MKSLRSILSLTLLAVSLPVLAGPPVYSLLEKSRPFIKFQDYTLQEKKLVLDQAKLIVNQVYVHRDLKIKTFGKIADPAPRFAEIEKNLESMPTADFHTKLSDLFNAFRDRHTLYNFPKPFACYESILPILVREVTDKTGKRVIAINEVLSNPEMDKLLKKPMKIERGDVIISYNGLPVEQEILNSYATSNGANNSAARHLSIAGLRYREHDLELLPRTNTVKLVLKNSQGKTYSEELPWITKKDWSCLAGSPVAIAHATKLEDEVDVFFWKILKNEHGSFGYIEIPTFDTELPDYWVERFKIIVRDELKDTDGLILDIRFNGGGNSSLAEKMIQLFTPKYIKPQLETLKATAPNLHFLQASNPKDPFTLATIEAQKNGQMFTKPLPMNNEAQMNAIGQFYFKPIAVFTDGYCYSSCDMLSAHMQDFGAATIFGERESTGGGGGNVFTLSSFMGYMNGNHGPFKELPYGQNFYFAFRQTTRSGKNAGKLIENVGVKADIINFPTMEDLMNFDIPQILKMSKHLAAKAHDYTSWVEMSEARQDYEIGSTPSAELAWQDTSVIKFSSQEKVIGASNVSNSSPSESVLIPVDTSKVKSDRLDLTGSFNEKDVWRKVLNYRVIPLSKTVSAPLMIRSQDLSLFTTSTALVDGWQVNGDNLVLGTETGYQDDVNAEASLFITPTSAMMLAFTALIKTEADCDFFSVVVVSEGEETVLLGPVSGNFPLQEYKYDLSAFAGKKIEIRFKFTSDSGTIAEGITLQNIGVL
jgi:C-terminal processing protease CtpA/Prc